MADLFFSSFLYLSCLPESRITINSHLIICFFFYMKIQVSRLTYAHASRLILGARFHRSIAGSPIKTGAKLCLKHRPYRVLRSTSEHKSPSLVLCLYILYLASGPGVWIVALCFWFCSVSFAAFSSIRITYPSLWVPNNRFVNTYIYMNINLRAWDLRVCSNRFMFNSP